MDKLKTNYIINIIQAVDKTKTIAEYLDTVHWSFTDNGWRDGEDGHIKAGAYEIVAMDKVLEYFKTFETNYIINIIKAVKELNYDIELAENTDSFGEHIHYYYDGNNKFIEAVAEENELDIVKFDKAFDDLIVWVNADKVVNISLSALDDIKTKELNFKKYCEDKKIVLNEHQKLIVEKYFDTPIEGGKSTILKLLLDFEKDFGC